MIDAELIAVGSELLTPYRNDTNTLWITEQLNAVGIRVIRKQIIGDDRAALADLFRAAGKRAGMVIACGGLGPTFDDVTRDALADACGLEMTYREEIWDWICARYQIRGRTPTENNRVQATEERSTLKTMSARRPACSSSMKEPPMPSFPVPRRR